MQKKPQIKLAKETNLKSNSKQKRPIHMTEFYQSDLIHTDKYCKKDTLKRLVKKTCSPAHQTQKDKRPIHMQKKESC